MEHVILYIHVLVFVMFYSVEDEEPEVFLSSSSLNLLRRYLVSNFQQIHLQRDLVIDQEASWTLISNETWLTKLKASLSFNIYNFQNFKYLLTNVDLTSYI